MTSSEALLWLLIFSFISAAVPLNPDDPNVCSHWERSVTSRLKVCQQPQGAWLHGRGVAIRSGRGYMAGAWLRDADVAA